MSLMGRLFGKVTQDEFAELVIKALQRHGETRPMTYSQEQFLLKPADDASSLLNLQNAYQEYCAAPRRFRQQVLDRWLLGWLQAEQLPKTWEQARLLLLPRVRERVFYEFLALRGAAEGRTMPRPFCQPLAEDLAVGLVLDLPNSIAESDISMFADWNISAEEAMKAALDNLWRRSNENFVSPAPGVFLSPWQDNHDCARLFLHDLVWQLKVEGQHVAMVPNRDTLIVTGSEDEAGLLTMAEMATGLMDKPRFMTGLAVRLEEATWVGFLPPPGHRAHQAFRTLRLKTLAQSSTEQKGILDQHQDKAIQELHVADHSLLAKKETGEMFSYCVWTKAVSSLLPQTEKVMFMDLERPKKEQFLGMAEWDRVMACAGDLLRPQGWFPERYRVDGFPSENQLVKLELAEL